MFGSLCKQVATKTTIAVRCLSLNSPASQIYPSDFLRPYEDPKFIWGHYNPKVGGKDFRAAPSINTYSNFYDAGVTKFEKMLIKKGKGYIAQRLMQKCLENIKLEQVEKINKDNDKEVEANPVKVFNAAIDNIKPMIGVTTYRKGAKSHQVPFPLKPRRQEYLSHKWILESTRLSKQQTRFVDRLSKEIAAAYIGQGSAMKKKQALHKTAEANRAYAHFRWDPAKQPKKLRGRKAAKAKQSKFSK